MSLNKKKIGKPIRETMYLGKADIQRWPIRSYSLKDLMKEPRNKIPLVQAVVYAENAKGEKVRAGTVTMVFYGYNEPRLKGKRFRVIVGISGKARKHAGMKPGQTWKRVTTHSSYRNAYSNFLDEIDHIKILSRSI